tara:strand:+ start:209 stop:832 length:624 start_codon:yes stop_codon:yes gene_type:complete
MKTKIKICGITNDKDALAAEDLGADALGFVFYIDSPRYVDPKDVFNLCKNVGPFVTRVGLFVDESVDQVNEAINISRINCLQFHGNETEDFCNQFGLPYIKSILMRDDINLLECCSKYKSASAILLDTYSESLKGGTGLKFDWDTIPKDLPCQLIVAGGLNNINVGELIDKINPYGIDVSGGVEVEKGKKDYNLMKEFILGVNNATV